MPRRWLKVEFERTTVQAIADALGDDFGFEGGNDCQQIAVLYTNKTQEQVSNEVWKLNGGAYCNITVIDEDVADGYL